MGGDKKRPPSATDRLLERAEATQGPLGGEAREGEGAIETLFLFRACGVGLASPAAYIRGVEEPKEPTPIPGAPPHVLGVFLHDEEVLPLVDLGLFCQLSGGGRQDDTMLSRTLLVRAGGFDVGLRCDHITGIAGVPAAALREPEILGPALLRRFLGSEFDWEGEVIGNLDVPLLLKGAAVT